MILVLHAAVYFLFCMMRISYLCSIMLQIYAKKAKGLARISGSIIKWFLFYSNDAHKNNTYHK